MFYHQDWLIRSSTSILIYLCKKVIDTFTVCMIMLLLCFDGTGLSLAVCNCHYSTVTLCGHISPIRIINWNDITKWQPKLMVNIIMF